MRVTLPAGVRGYQEGDQGSFRCATRNLPHGGCGRIFVLVQLQDNFDWAGQILAIQWNQNLSISLAERFRGRGAGIDHNRRIPPGDA